MSDMQPGPRFRAGGSRSLGGWASCAGVCMGMAIALLACMAITSSGCGGGQSMAPYEGIDQRKQEISMLWGQIRQWRQHAGLRGVEPPRGEIIKMQGKSMALAKAACPDDGAPKGQRCSDVCDLAEAICENAESICRIADELGGDAWADDKCSSAKASCKEAKTECCRCQGGAPTEEPSEEAPSE